MVPVMRCDYYSRGVYTSADTAGRPVVAVTEDRCLADASRYVLVHGPGQDVPLALCPYHDQDDFNLRGCRAEPLTADEYRALDVLYS